MLTPRQIENKQFRVVHLRGGYDQNEVDDYLDKVAETVDQLSQPRIKPGDQDTQVMAPVMLPVPLPKEDPPTPSEMIAKILAVAEETADKHIHEGKVSAEEIRLRAQDEVEALKAQAQMDAAAIIQEGQDERHKAIGLLEDQRAQLKEKVDELLRAEAEVTARMRNALERWTS